MILYLASNNNSNLLDFTGLYDENSAIKKMVGFFILKQFIVYDMRNFSHCTELVLDRTAFSDSDKDFVEAIEEFLIMYSARITVIYEGLEKGSNLFSSLLNAGVGNIVTAVNIENIQEEIRECLSDEGMTRYTVKKDKGNKKIVFDCENVKISVVGSQIRIGTTTLAIGLVSWINSVGGKVCYIERDNEKYKLLTSIYEMEKLNVGYNYNGIDFYNSETESKYNFIIFDNSIDVIKSKDINLLCCGGKPFEIPYSIRLIKQYESDNACLVCNFINSETQNICNDIFKSDCHNVLFMDYQPDFFDSKNNEKLYKSILSKYIKAV